MKSLDEEVDGLLSQMAEGRQAGQDELSRLKAELAETAEGLRRDLNQSCDDIAARIAAFETRAAGLDEDQEALSLGLARERLRLSRLRRWGVLGIGAIVGAALLVLFVAGVSARGIVRTAQSEAEIIRAQNAAAIEAARQEGEAELAALSEDLAERERALTADIEALGADLAQLTSDRDAARSDLEHFADLRDQIGFDLVRYREDVVIVVPEGETITGWNAPGFSDLARLNGRVFRVVSAD